ncbi:MAG: hypothetical protein PHH12_01275 [Candidatus Shapirobacteria bacterium]|nr:hypothetical protein [Candidatus Shapirobacteria bacterium]
MNNYLTLPISAIILISYLISFLLVKNKKISPTTQRRFWNIILLISFLISGTIGLILAILIDLKISILWYQNLLSLHVKTGTIMALVSLFHLFWHLPYYLSLIKKK